MKERKKKEHVLKVWAKSRLLLRIAIWSDVIDLRIGLECGENRGGSGFGRVRSLVSKW